MIPAGLEPVMAAELLSTGEELAGLGAVVVLDASDGGDSVVLAVAAVVPEGAGSEAYRPDSVLPLDDEFFDPSVFPDFGSGRSPYNENGIA